MGLRDRHLRYGWSALFLFLAFGLALEGLLGFKTPSYLLDPVRREMWRLAHAHGSLLALLNLVYASLPARGAATGAKISGGAGRGAASRAASFSSHALIGGSILLPAGFFLGGVQHYEGDPGIGVLLVPAGALLVLFVIGREFIAAWRRSPGTTA